MCIFGSPCNCPQCSLIELSQSFHWELLSNYTQATLHSTHCVLCHLAFCRHTVDSKAKETPGKVPYNLQQYGSDILVYFNFPKTTQIQSRHCSVDNGENYTHCPTKLHKMYNIHLIAVFIYKQTVSHIDLILCICVIVY